ncbi:hypothetical protein [Parasitella parasitica]|uniref:Uncharacterized protein n=1 Tax=Parasitella parasitica TaxID=35722 RepID=A0A0B7N4T6_9FUNG|nr:hypothetical protein [Parasitella parasitica]
MDPKTVQERYDDRHAISSSSAEDEIDEYEFQLPDEEPEQPNNDPDAKKARIAKVYGVKLATKTILQNFNSMESICTYMNFQIMQIHPDLLRSVNRDLENVTFAKRTKKNVSGAPPNASEASPSASRASSPNASSPMDTYNENEFPPTTSPTQANPPE